jgi:GTPase SAR1 family protein
MRHRLSKASTYGFVISWVTAINSKLQDGVVAKTKNILEIIVADFASLRAAYEKAGLLSGCPHLPTEKLLGGGDHIDHFRREFLLLDAVLRHRVARLVLGRGPVRNVVVFGGNNVGKSTVINILAGSGIASVSPEGAHTRHAHVFVTETTPLFGENPYAFKAFILNENHNEAEGNSYIYFKSHLAPGTIPENVALWDTPDCDAVGSSRYLASVVEAVAAADIVIYVTTVEKYTVRHIVEWLFNLQDAGIPIIECLNKTPRRDRETVIRKQQNDVFPMMAEQLGLPPPDPRIIALGNMTEGEESDLWGPEHVEAQHFRQAVFSSFPISDEPAVSTKALAFILRRLDKGLEPARMEIEARRQWTTAVTDAVDGFIASYERSYLTSATVIEPITRLNLEILELLDPNIPGLKQTMAAIRWITRWPSRLFLAIGRSAYNFGREVLSGTALNNGTQLAPELKAYSEAHTELLNSLGKRIDKERAATRHHPFWDKIGDEWQGQLSTLTREFAAAIEVHMKRTDEEIKAAARDIFEKLKQRPATLNILRTARVVANTGGAFAYIIIPGHGGIVYDLIGEVIIAPAMITATEAAASAIAQNYLIGRRDEILKKLKADARIIAQTLYEEPLLAISEVAMSRAGALGVDEEILERLPKNLRKLHSEFAGARR